jgi:hypothetical protein
MTTVQWLQHCSNKPIVLEDEFTPTERPHKGCMFTTVMFDTVAYDYMEIDSFEKNFGKDKFIALYVNKVCPNCGSVKCDSEAEEIQYLKVVPNTPANRKRYGYQWEDNSEKEESE